MRAYASKPEASFPPDVADDYGQQIVDVMRDAPRHPSQRFRRTGLLQLIFGKQASFSLISERHERQNARICAAHDPPSGQAKQKGR